jgi:Icc-related predicted phosphoesterase
MVSMETRVRIAAAGDIHASESHRDHLERAFEGIGGRADLVLLAGDLTTYGEPDEARVLAQICRGADVPVVAVLGNHDVHAGRVDELTTVLEDGGIRVLQRSCSIFDVDGVQVGIVGTKGFVGGFPGSTLPDFGEPLLRQAYLETTEEANAIASGLQEISHCPLRIVLLHYSPVVDTLDGEPLGIHSFLGSSRLALPIAEHPPDLVLHGHAHAGRFEGRIGDVPVYNVAVHVTGTDFYVFELTVERPGHPAVEVETGPA